MIFELFPLVEIAKTISFEFAIELTCLEKTFLYPKSFAIAVIADVSVFKQIEGIGYLFFKKRPTNSAEKCWLSAAEPPFPKIIILFLFFFKL